MKWSMKNAIGAFMGNYPFPSRWVRLWLFFKGRAYASRRDRILLHKAEHRAKRLLADEWQKPSLLVDSIAKDDTWRGGYFPVPIISEEARSRIEANIAEVGKQRIFLPPSHHTLCDLKSCEGGTPCFERNRDR